MEILKTYRESHGLSQKEFGERVGIDQSLISRMEKGRISISLENAKKIERGTAGVLTRLQLMPHIFEGLTPPEAAE